ncbi:hypothetical protein [uncultured Methylobacterium sp.]|uniref:hypothetical protein n=1 Tax=uncultured Methylobacterium sp. TaxID=157278 RepID=UPI002607A90C|nr:hypothetical protein [uncultured Methylobacterium sp.]
MFGPDTTGRVRAARFPAEDATTARQAAAMMGLRTLDIARDEHREVALQLAQGRLYASGRAFLPFVAKPLYDRLCALAGGATDQTPASNRRAAGEPPSKPTAAAPPPAPSWPQPAPAPLCPEHWSGIVVGSLVLMREGEGHGWYEAVVVESKAQNLFVLRWRDWPELPTLVRRRQHLALLHPSMAGPGEPPAAASV